ncbi:unnamed protein product, partial [Laminaria digitata]
RVGFSTRTIAPPGPAAVSPLVAATGWIPTTSHCSSQVNPSMTGLTVAIKTCEMRETGSRLTDLVPLYPTAARGPSPPRSPCPRDSPARTPGDTTLSSTSSSSSSSSALGATTGPS